MSFQSSLTNTLAWTNTLAYRGIRTLRIHNGFIALAPGEVESRIKVERINLKIVFIPGDGSADNVSSTDGQLSDQIWGQNYKNYFHP
jgi:hypothetical protein